MLFTKTSNNSTQLLIVFDVMITGMLTNKNVIELFIRGRKPYFFLVIDATLASDNLLHFRKNLSERI